jgi:cytochrome c biogenesis protein CcdA
LTSVSFLAAFLGGLLALLAPCSALLLPAFFAYAFSNRTALLRGTLLFLVGLCVVLLPLGLAASLAGHLLIEQRGVTILVSGVALIALGALMAFGSGGSLLPTAVAAKLATGAGGPATLATGVIYGLTGFCSGPLLGAVLTLAAAGHSPWSGAPLLLVYALGMSAPLFILAAAWDRYDLGHRRWLRASVRHANVIGGVLFVALGATFIATQGGLLLSGAYESVGLDALGLRLQDWLANTFEVS